MNNKDFFSEKCTELIYQYGLLKVIEVIAVFGFIFNMVVDSIYPNWKSSNMTLECFLELELSCNCGNCSTKKIDTGKNIVGTIIKYLDDNPEKDRPDDDTVLVWMEMILKSMDELSSELIAKDALNDTCWN